MSTVCITGMDGFIGSNLGKELKKVFNEVRSIEETIFDIPDWKEYLLDILNFYKPQAIFHVGACSDTLETDVNYMMIRNYESTKVLVDWCISNQKPIVYSSSAANYGIGGKYPSNLYGWSKYAAEDYVITNGGIALRYFNVYGPGEEHKDKMASVAYQMYMKHKKGEEIKLFPKEPKRDFVYVKDVVSANLYALKNHYKLAKKYYDVGVGEAKTFEYILDTLEIPYSYTTENEIPKGYQFFTQSSQKKWMKGWKPKYNVETGLKEYKEYLCKII